MLYRSLELLAKGLLFLSVLTGMLLTSFVVLACVMRYLVGSPFGFTEEIVGLLFIATAFLGLPYATLHNLHLRITLIPERLPPFWRTVAESASTLFIVAFCFFFGLFSWEFAAMSLRFDARTEMGGLALFPWMALLPATVALMAVVAAARLARRLSGHPDRTPTGEPPAP